MSQYSVSVSIPMATRLVTMVPNQAATSRDPRRGARSTRMPAAILVQAEKDGRDSEADPQQPERVIGRISQRRDADIDAMPLNGAGFCAEGHSNPSLSRELMAGASTSCRGSSHQHACHVCFRRPRGIVPASPDRVRAPLAGE